MRQVQVSITLLLIAVICFLSLWHYVVVPLPNSLAISFFVYVMIAASLTLQLRIISQQHAIVVLGGSVLLYVIWRVGWQQLMGGMPVNLFPSMGIELAALLCIIFLAHTVSSDLSHIELTLFELGLHDTPKRLADGSADDTIQSELMRSRFTGHPLSLIMISADVEGLNNDLQYSNDLIRELEFEFGKQFFFTQLARRIRKNLRFIDNIYHDEENNRLIVVCPSVEPQEANTISKNIERTVYQEMGIKSQCHIASFPDEAITLDGLIESANQYAEVNGAG